MQVLYPCCCGLDIQKWLIVACRILPGDHGQPLKEIRTVSTMTSAILELADWLAEAGVTHVATESRGGYWKPVYNLLAERFTLLLVNAAHIKAVPGRKTDVKDAEWIADLLRHGLLSPSHAPPRPHRELRELTHYRTNLVQERAAEVNRLQKTLEGANLLAAVVSDLTARSAHPILTALVRGQTEAHELAGLAKGRLREKLPQLKQSLVESFGPHQRFLVAQQLTHIDDLEKSIQAVQEEIERRLQEPPPPLREEERPNEAGSQGAEASERAREGVAAVFRVA
jgi:transposase